MKNRKSNIELLRIVSIILIIFSHFAVHSNFALNTFSINKMYLHFIQIGGVLGVNLFVLISGYFLVNTTQIKINKLLRLWLQIVSYSIGIYLIFSFFNQTKFSLIIFIKNSLPITFEIWWFASVYILIYLFSPYINKFLKTLNKTEYTYFLTLCTLLWYVLAFFTNSDIYSNRFIQLLYVYCIGGYIRCFFDNYKLSFKKNLLIVMVITLITYFCVLCLDIMGIKVNFFLQHSTVFYNPNSPFLILLAIFMFLLFKNININNNKVINTLSSTIFGVYLIHDNPYVREFIWLKLFKCWKFEFSPFLIFYSIIVCFLVLFVCILIELLRINVFEIKYIKYLNFIESKIKRFSHSSFVNYKKHLS